MHEISKPFFGGNIKKKYFIMSSDEFYTQYAKRYSSSNSLQFFYLINRACMITMWHSHEKNK